MGVCSSCESTSVATTKLIHEDGRLEEFPYQVRVSRILERNPSCFICNADDMDFDDYVSAIDGDEELQLGQLYFALPLSWLNSRLTAHQMAALAIKASVALKISGGSGGWCCPRRVEVVELITTKKVTEETPMMATHGGGNGGFVVKQRGSGHGGAGDPRARKFATTNLSVILEE